MNHDWSDTVTAVPGVLDSEPGQAYLVVVRGRNVGKTYPVTGPDMVLGRAAGVDLQLDDEGVSRFHCKLREVHNGTVVEDLGSLNGTYCNGERVVPGMRPLQEGDRIQVGTISVLRFTYVEIESGPIVNPDANRDALTGTYSRRYFMDRLDAEVGAGAAAAGAAPLSLVLIHIDRYTELVVSHGQEFADKITIRVAGLLGDAIAGDDILARLDSGDFALMSRRASPGDMFMMSERLRKAAIALNIVPTVTSSMAATLPLTPTSPTTLTPPPSDEQPVKVALSLGVASANELGIDNVYELLLAAGSALHRATKQGGNRVVLCTQDLLHEPKNTKYRPK